MSEPMSSVEIEDVLSSIRRLVSDDLRAQPRAPQPQVEAPAQAAGDKLLLTPALRIVPDAEPEIEPEPAFHSIRTDGASVTEAAPEAAFVALDDDLAQEVGAEAAAPQGVVTDLSDYYEDEVAAAAPADTVIPEAIFAARDEAPAAAPSQPQADTAQADERDWADAAEAAVRAELEDSTINTAFAQFLDDAPETGSMDEEALRDMVRDIIREELQGTLGERITRNVRKLVRAEVARALAVRDFE